MIRVVPNSETNCGIKPRYPPLQIPTFFGYHVDPLLKKEVCTLKNQVFQTHIEKVGIWSSGYVFEGSVQLIPVGEPASLALHGIKPGESIDSSRKESKGRTLGRMQSK